MSKSKIRLVNSKTTNIFPAAPDEGVIFSSADAGWRGITIELHRISSQEMPEHYVEGHRLAINLRQSVQYEWKDGSRWRQSILKQFCLVFWEAKSGDALRSWRVDAERKS